MNGMMLREETKNLARKNGVELRKEKDQSHLVDESVLKRIIDYADLDADERILEIGAGLGNLTKYLLDTDASIFAVEKDERLVEVLRQRFGGSELEIIHGDALETDLPDFDKVVANLPYSISSPISFHLAKRKFDLGVLMYQKEFADRMMAEPGSSEYSRLSVNLSLHYDVELLEEVSPDKFFPQPEVSSSIVRVTSSDPSYEISSRDIFHKVVTGVFQHRRKKLRNGLYNSFVKIFQDLDFSDKEKRNFIDDNIPEEIQGKRPGKVTPEQFAKLANNFAEKKKI